ncbi:hypothetical protein [Profundibacter amoris]|jgi:hypothetical protein|nr:hypothetical protein [Profundibacter amoris]
MMGNQLETGMGYGMGWGMGLGGIGMLLVVAVFVLGIIALLKYIRN